jgi:hypothetical protein
MRTGCETIRLGRPRPVSERTLLYPGSPPHMENSGSGVSQAIGTLLADGSDKGLRRTKEANEAS